MAGGRAAAWLEAELQQVDASPEELQLAEMLIHSASGPFDWPQFRDDTSDKLAALVAAKVAGQQIISPVEEPLLVLPLLDALKQSVARTQSASATDEPAGPAKRRRSA